MKTAIASLALASGVWMEKTVKIRQDENKYTAVINTIDADIKALTGQVQSLTTDLNPIQDATTLLVDDLVAGTHTMKDSLPLDEAEGSDVAILLLNTLVADPPVLAAAFIAQRG